MMKHMTKVAPLLVLGLLAGCVMTPAGPTVSVLPAPNKPFEQFMNDDATCRKWAESKLGGPVQELQEQNVATGAAVGTAAGAGLGAAMGAASGNAGVGAAIGAGMGLLFGSAIGSESAQQQGYQAQKRYDNAYVQCMYSYGNQIPGVKKYVASNPPRVAAAPPPPPTVAAPPPPAVVTPPPPPVADPEEAYYPPPPEVYFDDAPRFIYSPEMKMYVAIGVPYDLVYTGRDYYYFNGGRWYRSPYYNGPWVYAPRRTYPRAFLEYRVTNIRRYRDAEYRRYMREREHYQGRMHRPEYRGERRSRMEHRSELR